MGHKFFIILQLLSICKKKLLKVIFSDFPKKETLKIKMFLFLFLVVHFLKCDKISSTSDFT